MKKITNYISEKLLINKDVKLIKDISRTGDVDYSYNYHTEWFSEYNERGGIGINCDKLEEAIDWCKKTCKEENNPERVYIACDHKYKWNDSEDKCFPYVCCLDKYKIYHNYTHLEELK